MPSAEHVVGPAADFAEGEKRIIDIGGRSVGVFRSNGEFFAVRNQCPHDGAHICLANLTDTALPSSRPGEFVYGMHGFVLRCPWHGWEFDVRSGEALFGTDDRRLATYPVRIDDGNVIVTLRDQRRPARAGA